MKKNKDNHEFILIAASIIFLIFSGILIFRPVQFDIFALKTQSPRIIGKAVLTIDFGNGEKRAFEGEIINNETLINALMQASGAGNFSYKLDQKSDLMAIEKFVADGKKSWQWYLNGKKINKPLNEIMVKDGDNILVKYE